MSYLRDLRVTILREAEATAKAAGPSNATPAGGTETSWSWAPGGQQKTPKAPPPGANPPGPKPPPPQPGRSESDTPGSGPAPKQAPPKRGPPGSSKAPPPPAPPPQK
eukprot:670746-Amphidinium_carterae.1